MKNKNYKGRKELKERLKISDTDEKKRVNCKAIECMFIKMVPKRRGIKVSDGLSFECKG